MLRARACRGVRETREILPPAERGLYAPSAFVAGLVVVGLVIADRRVRVRAPVNDSLRTFGLQTFDQAIGFSAISQPT
jgi:hypothetical protein